MIAAVVNINFSYICLEIRNPAREGCVYHVMMHSRKTTLNAFIRCKAEAFIWLAVLISMMLSRPVTEGHLTLCPLALMGFDWCPGCGVGRSMILALHGQISASISMHPLGLVALAVLAERIYEILFLNPKIHNL